VTGRLDAFQWQTPLAALPSSRPALVEAEVPEQIAGDAPRVEALPAALPNEHSVLQDGATPAVALESSSSGVEATTSPTFQTQSDAGKPGVSDIPAVIPIVRAPDDPGVDEDQQNDGFAEENTPAARQAGGLRGLLSRRST
jgi:HemY protein